MTAIARAIEEGMRTKPETKERAFLIDSPQPSHLILRRASAMLSHGKPASRSWNPTDIRCSKSALPCLLASDLRWVIALSHYLSLSAISSRERKHTGSLKKGAKVGKVQTRAHYRRLFSVFTARSGSPAELLKRSAEKQKAHINIFQSGREPQSARKRLRAASAGGHAPPLPPNGRT